jgi:broad specificity phosphatase PhoE
VSVNRLLLIKHASPVLDMEIPAAEWVLSAEGQRRCVQLAEQAAAYDPAVVVCSREPKASETGQLMAAALGLPWQVMENLHEHKRPQAGLLSQEEFHAQVEKFFASPGELVFGAETAHQAQMRFSHAVEKVLAHHPGQNVAIVAHGTVISLFVAQKTGMASFPLWQRLGLPSLVVLSLPDFKLEKVIEDVR